MTADKAKALGLKPRARVIQDVVVGTDPYYLLDGPVDATQELFRKTGIMKKFADGAEGEGVTVIGDAQGGTTHAPKAGRPKKKAAKAEEKPAEAAAEVPEPEAAAEAPEPEAAAETPEPEAAAEAAEPEAAAEAAEPEAAAEAPEAEAEEEKQEAES